MHRVAKIKEIADIKKQIILKKTLKSFITRTTGETKRRANGTEKKKSLLRKTTITIIRILI